MSEARKCSPISTSTKKRQTGRAFLKKLEILFEKSPLGRGKNRGREKLIDAGAILEDTRPWLIDH